MPVSIRSRLLLLVLSLLLPATAAAFWVIVSTYDAERSAQASRLRDTTRALSMVVDGELAQRAAIARVLAQSRSLDAAPDLTAEDVADFERQARRSMHGLQGWVVLRSARGEIVDTRAPEGGRPKPDTAPVTLVDAPAVLPMTPGGVTGELHASVVHPLRRGGRTVLDIAVTILPQELQAIIDQQRMPPDWFAAIVDSQGVLVARQPGGSEYAGRPVTTDFQHALAAGREGGFESVTLEGVPVSGYFSTSPQGWSYVISLPRSWTGSLFPPAVLQVGIGAVVLLGLAVGAALWVSRRIVAPVMSLKVAAARLQAGLPVERRGTGILECDEVASALAEAGEAMRHARADLERQVDDAVRRTREAEQRASQSQRVEALGRLTGGVAHDFNNLLGVISNSAHLIERHATTPELQLPVAATLRAVEVGSRLTQHLLRFAGRQPVRPQALQLQLYLPEMQELIGTVLGKRIELSVEVDSDTPPITVDSSELELALINLALNARDAITKSGHVWLHARPAENDECAGLPRRPYVLLSVTDDGQGLDEGLAERVFEPFFTTKAVGKGTGLGLSQVHGFCVQAGGTARLTSTPGLGTTVSMLLPAGAAEAGAPAPPAEPTRTHALAGQRLLLVEDNDELGAVTAALLSAWGCRVARAAGPQEAVARIERGETFDLVLSDVVMPGGMDGIALARWLRERQPRLPIVLISGYSAASTKASDFTMLHKPCSPEELVAALQQAMQAAATAAT